MHMNACGLIYGFLCCAGCERLFSAAGRMHDDLKKATNETTLEHSLMVFKNA